ncbi:MAG: pilus assembly PilX N-terminal domain-containing protein [Candidatus Levybacteria bacterium]|nr:pilus assembly PilX N-terminal domain-containing protein [Candidatus Levybacteria bacterium]
MKTKFKVQSLKFKVKEKGQALITLLFFVLISLTITSGAIIIIITNSTSASKLAEGTQAYYAAESGVENALLRLLRDPNYTGETLTIGSTTAVITVTGANPKTVVSIGQNGNFKRKVSTQMTYSNGYYTFSNWKEL